MITLGIIGIVAAMTLPALTAAYQKKVFAMQTKKFYSEISQAYEIAKVKYGEPDSWTHPRVDCRYYGGAWCFPDAYTILNQTMKAKYCDEVNRNKYQAYVNDVKENAGLNNSYNFTTYIMKPSSDGCYVLNDGKLVLNWGISEWETNGRRDFLVGGFLVDVNGTAKPNKYGKDIHGFFIVHYPPGRNFNWSGGRFQYTLELTPGMKSAVYPGGLGWVNKVSGSVSFDTCNDKKTWACTAKLMQDGWEFKKDYPW